jgi:hypothetical protein
MKEFQGHNVVVILRDGRTIHGRCEVMTSRGDNEWCVAHPVSWTQIW